MEASGGIYWYILSYIISVLPAYEVHQNRDSPLERGAAKQGEARCRSLPLPVSQTPHRRKEVQVIGLSCRNCDLRLHCRRRLLPVQHTLRYVHHGTVVPRSSNAQSCLLRILLTSSRLQSISLSPVYTPATGTVHLPCIGPQGPFAHCYAAWSGLALPRQPLPLVT